MVPFGDAALGSLTAVASYSKPILAALKARRNVRSEGFGPAPHVHTRITSLESCLSMEKARVVPAVGFLISVAAGASARVVSCRDFLVVAGNNCTASKRSLGNTEGVKVNEM